jgi:poly(hydroxyalkanoate) depolymerase family esterase
MPAMRRIKVFRMHDGLVRRLASLTRRLLAAGQASDRDRVAPAVPAREAAATVVEVAAFGDNPGRLTMKLLLPAPAPRPGAPLLVLLHGCGQDAVRFAEASGFAALAQRQGAALLLPDQVTDNNPQRCFNWFRPADIARGGGEAASIRAMVSEAVRRWDADPRRVFVAGLSAGGAMAAALLAAYPDAFAAGGVVAGLPVGAATDAHAALLQMTRPQPRPREAWLALLAEGAATDRPWPRLSVWHGAADHVVDPANAAALVGQWTARLGLPEAPERVTQPAPHVTRRCWGEAVEYWSIAGYGHAFPVDDGMAADPFVLPAGIAAAAAMARFWGLGDP